MRWMRCPAEDCEAVAKGVTKNSFAKLLRINLFDRFTTHLIRLLLRTAPQNPPSPAGEGYGIPSLANHRCNVFPHPRPYPTVGGDVRGAPHPAKETKMPRLPARATATISLPCVKGGGIFVRK